MPDQIEPLIWGEETYTSKAEAEHCIARYLADQLCEADLGFVNVLGELNSYALEITVRLVPEGVHLRGSV
jgi:hypothetical protein